MGGQVCTGPALLCSLLADSEPLKETKDSRQGSVGFIRTGGVWVGQKEELIKMGRRSINPEMGSQVKGRSYFP